MSPSSSVTPAVLVDAVEPVEPAEGRQPTPQELAAIVAAVELAWPRAVVVVDDAPPRPPVWRFSGRWWLPRLPVAANRNRP